MVENSIESRIEYLLSMHNMQLNTNTKIVESIKLRIKKCNGHCPCIPVHKRNQDTICPCANFRKDGICKCNLYTKNK